jgi:CRP-like cAMP-binding protein
MDDLQQTLMTIFPEADAAALDFLAQNATVRQYPAEVKLCNEGEIEDVMYILLDGQVEIWRFMDGEMILVDALTEKTTIGAFSLVLETPRTSDVITSEPVTVMEINRRVFLDVIEAHPHFMLTLTRMWLAHLLAQEAGRLVNIARQRKTQTDRHSIFISYARADETFVRKLAHDLKKHQLSVWLDVFDIDAGKSWARQIGKALDTCQAMILVLSPSSIASENVEDEWNYYLDKKKPIIPLFYQPCDVPYRLYRLQYISFHETAYKSALARLVASAGQILA